MYQQLTTFKYISIQKVLYMQPHYMYLLVTFVLNNLLELEFNLINSTVFAIFIYFAFQNN